jgi:multidrug transporter EmrE-like cation transporter
MGWVYLCTAIVTEVIGTTALKATEGFTRPVPAAIVFIGYALSFYFLALALKSIQVGVAYAVWSGLGIVMISLLARIFYGQTLSFAALGGMGLIIVGVCVIKLSSSES